MTNVQKRYFREIKKKLPCNASAKKRYFLEFTQSVSMYVQDSPNVSYEELCSKFGSPEAIAAAYVEHNAVQVTHNAKQKRTCLLTIGIFNCTHSCADRDAF